MSEAPPPSSSAPPPPGGGDEPPPPAAEDRLWPAESAPPPPPASEGPPAQLPPPRNPSLTGARWGIGVAFLGAGAALVLQGVIVLLVVPLTGTTGFDFGFAAQLSFGISLVAVAAFFAIRRAGRGAALRTLGIRLPRPGWAGTTALAYFAFLGFAFALALLTGGGEQQDLEEELDAGDGALATVGLGFLILLVAPIGEEVFFRGFFYAAVRQRLGFIGAVVFSGLIFGLIHFTTSNVVAVVQLAAFGMVLAWLYERTGSIVPCVLLHFVNNALAFTLLQTSG